MRYGYSVHQLGRASLLLGVLSVFLPQFTSAQSATSTWECLPDETVVAVRIPNGRAFVEAFVRDTKFGAVMFSEQRKAAIAKVLESEGSGKWSEFQEQLNEYGLTTDELVGLLAGESGYAVVMTAQDEEKPLFAGLGWLEPGEELVGKVFDVIAKVIDEQDEEHPITRVDLTLADQPVMQLQVPSIELKYSDKMDVGDDYEDLPYKEKRKVWQEAYEKWKETAVETIVYRTVLVSTLGDRLLMAHSYQALEEEASATAAEQLSAVYAQWIDAHASGAEGMVARLADDPGVARVMALDGLPVFELLGDVSPLIELLQATAKSTKTADQVVRMLGLGGLGPFAMRSTVEGTQWSTNLSVAVPVPRQGLMRLFDQEPLALDPPQWVPTNVVQYYQWSFDLGKAYEIIKDEALREFPDKAAKGFTMIETQTQNFAQASLSEVLSSLGNRHTFLSFAVEANDEVAGNSDNDDDDDERSVKVHVGVSSKDRMAIVWQVEDEELWARLFKAIAPFAGMAPGTEFTEEQGFSGWRMKKEQAEGGLFLGKGYLVLGYGSGVLESMLSSINNPPTGSGALRGSEVFSKAGELIDLEPAMAVEITDGNRYMSMMVGALEKQLEQLAKVLERANPDEDDESASQWMLTLAHAVLPSQKELEGMMGVIVGRWEVNDDGLFGESVQEMPAP